jgi:hypothetical protein
MSEPWWQRTLRWGQTNLTEIDPAHYDHGFWRSYWQETGVQGLIINAGGIVAYYPSRDARQYRAAHLGDRDLFGEIVQEARAAGLTVLARMDSNRARPSFYQQHPDWFCQEADGKPCTTAGGDWVMACVNSPYYHDYIPSLLQEIIERYQVDGFTDNSWTGLGRSYICHCPHCQQKFRDDEERDLPAAVDWQDPVYRRWIRWNYRCRTENWKRNNDVCWQHGGRHCLWLGMIGGNPLQTHVQFCDLPRISAQTPVLMSDTQSRTERFGFAGNAFGGKLLHELVGWDAIIPESMAMYVRGAQSFRRAANPAAESLSWMHSGMAGGILPWWHHVGASQEDGRQFDICVPLMNWHRQHQAYLTQRQPVATVALLWSHENNDFYGQEQVAERVSMPQAGWLKALVRARIPHLPVHMDRLDAQRFRVAILPEMVVMSDAQVARLREFIQAGGSLVISGCCGMWDELGHPISRPELAAELGISCTGRSYGVAGDLSTDWEDASTHNYLRLHHDAGDAAVGILHDFAATNILALGGLIHETRLADDAQVLATYLPSFPVYPPEFAWMRTETTDIPAISHRQLVGGGHLLHFAVDLDRAYARRGLPDYAGLMAAAVRHAAGGRVGLRVDGPGSIDCQLYRQGDRRILHVVNQSGADVWPGYREEFLPVGPLRIRIEDAPNISQVRCLVAGGELDLQKDNDDVVIELAQLVDHQVLVAE